MPGIIFTSIILWDKLKSYLWATPHPVHQEIGLTHKYNCTDDWHDIIEHELPSKLTWTLLDHQVASDDFNFKDVWAKTSHHPTKDKFSS